MSCATVKCALNATCYETGAFTYFCRCDIGFEGDGYINCKSKPFEEFTVMLALTVIFFFVLLFLLIFIACRNKKNQKIQKPKTYNRYNINWNGYIKEWKSTTIRGKEKTRKPLDQNGCDFIVETDVDKTLSLTFKIDDETVQEQKSKLNQASRSDSIRINITNEDIDGDADKKVDAEDDEIKDHSVGIDNPAFLKQQSEEKDGLHENISLKSFKPVAEDKETLKPVERTPPERPPPYSSKHSFKENRRSPRVQPKIVPKEAENDDTEDE